MAVQSTDLLVIERSSTLYKAPVGDLPESKSIAMLEPTGSEELTLFFTKRAITIKQITSVVRGTSPSLTFTIRHNTDRSATGAEVVTGGTTVTNTTTGSVVTSFNNASIAANSWVWIENTAKSGTVDEFHVSVHF